VSQGFTVSVGALSAGERQLVGFVPPVESTGSDVVQAITGMAGSASGHAGLASALMSAAESSTRTFPDLGAAYRHAGESLAAAASVYDRAEQAVVASVGRIGGGR